MPEQIIQLAKEIIKGRRLTESEDLSFLMHGELNELGKAANDIREQLCQNQIYLCTIINGKSGRCSENCKFCAQSSYHKTQIENYPFLDPELILADAKENEQSGIHRYSIVTAGKHLMEQELDKAVRAYQLINKQCKIKLCASHGLLTEEEFRKLKESGVTRYHANIETSESNFSNICTTHSFEDKQKCIKAAQKAGLEVCSGGIIGMGETFKDRIEMALCLAKLKVVSIPINILIPIKGTILEDLEPLREEEILRTIALFRFTNPTAEIRLAAGRSLLKDHGKQAFRFGANAAITGNMLTTIGCNIKQDIEMLTEMGYSI